MSQNPASPSRRRLRCARRRRRRSARRRRAARRHLPPRQRRARDPASGAIIVLVLIIASLAWYFVADRLTPYTLQARVQAFVVPVAAEVSGKLLKVHVRDNDTVQPGQPLFNIDPVPYQDRAAAQPVGL